jgi:aspartyl aminopeptidase
MQVAVETYGGGIWRSWFDRDLSLAGRVIVATSSSKFESRLVNLRRPLLRIPSLAIHLDRDSAESFKFNKETQFTPILGLASAQLNAAGKGDEKGDGKERHWSGLIEVLAEELGVGVEDVKDFELYVSLFSLDSTYEGQE